MQNIVWTNNGKVAVTYVYEQVSAAAHAQKLVAQGDMPAGWSVALINAQLPEADMDMFGAWVVRNNKIEIDLPQAREVTKSRLRTEREPLLAALDVQFQRALETGASTTAIVAEKQRLRDLPSLADGCFSLAELRALKP